ncbi:MAG: hypothetical protein GXX90_07750 [Microbacteriaceae bacterium]|nr:hypothetical protein [Microbacteriaceae bacterium]
MVRSRRGQSSGARRTRGSRSRHGRELRSSAAGPHLPQLTGRIPRFMQAVSETLGYLNSIAPEQMAPVRVAVAPMPADDQHRDGMDRWHIRPPHEVILFRVPIERLAGMPLSNYADQSRYREYVERTVVAAVSELLDGGIDDLLGEAFWDDDRD